MKKKTGISLGTLISAAISLVGVILTIVAVCSSWLTYKAESVLGDASSSFKLSELSELEGYGLMAAMAYATLAVAVIALALRVAEAYVKSIPSIASKGAGILAIALAIVVLIASIVVCSNNGGFSLGGYASGKFVVSAGVILSTLGGILGGVGAFLHLDK
jgi:hypothetical protein